MTQAEWIPPGKSELGKSELFQILNEATEDRQNKNYKTALEKYLWFHNNVLTHDKSFYAVRLSSALFGWVELTKVYEPALKSLNGISDKAENDVRINSAGCSAEFHDFVSINEELGRNKKIVGLFKWLDSNKPLVAQKRFHSAQPALIKSDEFIICGKYIDPEVDLSRLQKMYTMNIKTSEDPKFGEEMKEFAEKSYLNGVATLVAILSTNSRNDEASKIAEESKNTMSTKEFMIELEHALSGTPPTPWP